MTTTEPTSTTVDTDERIVVIPEITISAAATQAVERLRTLAAEIQLTVDEMSAAVQTVRAGADEVTIALLEHAASIDVDDVMELADKVSGWDDVWELVAGIGDAFGTDTGQGLSCGMQRHELIRGERDFPKGTVAVVPDAVEPGVIGEPDMVRVEVEWGPHHPLAEGGYLCIVHFGDRRIVCTHEEIKAGLQSVPGEEVADQ